ncbi:D-alanine--D-alanine ligase family protein [Yinghuangia seranimata]|uniref:D-alanine--D-alanine ligase family protein n=1 Tax=Yinghuangia seranimata TaxID=408067 RepID=UPI003CCF0D41
MGILTGGTSRERERSLATARDVADALAALGHTAQLIDTADAAFAGAVRGVDAAFLAIAGRGAEDGTLQGFLQAQGIAYTGSGVRASALAMHKPTAKTVAAAAGVPVLPGVQVHPTRDAGVAAKEVLDALPAPVIVKPESEGSSIDIAVAHDVASLTEVLTRLRRSGQPLLAEPFMAGRAVTVGVLEEDGEPVALPVVEVTTDAEFYDHTAKLDPAGHAFHCPADLPAGVAEALTDAACLAHRALGCAGYSRSDFVVADDGTFAWLELNTLPGLRRSGTLALMAEAAGATYEQLIDRVLATAYTGEPR